MPLRTIATFAIAVVLGLIAVVLINMYMGSSRKSQVAQTQAGVGAPVVVAAAAIGRGATLQPTQLKVVNYPAGSVPSGSFQTVAQVAPTAKDQQRVAMRDVAVDEPILSTTVSAPGGKLSMSTELDPGMQAITLRSNDITGVAGFVLPGDRVDIMLSRGIGKGESQSSVTQVVAQNMKVMAVDQVDDEQQSKPIVSRSITLEVTPEQAQQMVQAQTMGMLSLALRHVQDTAPDTRLATTAAAFGFSSPVTVNGKPVRRRPRGPEVRVTRATETTVYQLGAR